MAGVTLPYPSPTDSGEYAEDLDVELGAKLPVSPAALEVTSAWIQSESPGFPGYNALGTELDLPGAVPDASNPHVFDYPTLQEGLAAAVDMIEGKGPQTTALAPKFATDVASGKATATQLVDDINVGNGTESWTGSGPDTYDSTAILSKLNSGSFSIAGSPADGSNAASTSADKAQADSFLGGLGGSIVNGILPGASSAAGVAGSVGESALGSLAGDIGIYLLKGILTLVGGGLVFYGFTLLTDRGGKSAAPAAAAAPDEDDLLAMGALA